MVPISLLEQAKDGDAAAIAALMNQALEPRGITVRGDRQGDCLQLWLMGQTLPPQAATVDYVRRGIDRLQATPVGALQIYAEQVDRQEPGWGVEVVLGTDTAEIRPLVLEVVADPQPELVVAAGLDLETTTELPSPSAAPGTIPYAYALLGLGPDDSLQKVEGTYFKLKALAIREGDRARVEDLKRAFHQLKDHIEHPPAKVEAAATKVDDSSDGAQEDALTPIERVEALLKRRGVIAKTSVQGSQLNLSWLAVRVSNPEDAASEVRALLTHQSLASMGVDGVETLVISALSRDQAVVWQQALPLAKR